MPVPFPRPRAVSLLLALAAALLLAAGLASSAMACSTAACSTRRPTIPPATPCSGSTARPTARSTPAGTFATGGAGLADLGGRQGAVELSGDGRYLYAVNAGSDSVSVFRAGPGGTAADRHRRLARRRAGQHRRGTAAASTSSTPAARRTSPRSGAASTARCGRSGARAISPPGAHGRRAGLGHARRPLARRHRARRQPARDAAARPPRPSGRAGRDRVQRRRPVRLRHHAAAARSSSPRPARAPSRPTALGAGGALRTITASLPVGQGAACWVAVSPNGRFAYTGNAAGGISGFAIARDGSLTALGTTSRAVPVAARPRLRRERPLPARRQPGRATGGQVTSYRVGNDGSLSARRHRAGRGRHHRRRRLTSRDRCNAAGGRATNVA